MDLIEFKFPWKQFLSVSVFLSICTGPPCFSVTVANCATMTEIRRIRNTNISVVTIYQRKLGSIFAFGEIFLAKYVAIGNTCNSKNHDVDCSFAVPSVTTVCKYARTWNPIKRPTACYGLQKSCWLMLLNPWPWHRARYSRRGGPQSFLFLRHVVYEWRVYVVVNRLIFDA
jgi:hypothetical protein